MNKRIYWIIGILAVVVVVGLATLWLSGPMAFGPAMYGMGPGMMSGGWVGMTTFGLVFVLTRVAFWLVPVILIVALATWLLRPRVQEQEN